MSAHRLFVSSEVMAKVAGNLDVKFESWMQDWPLEVANPARLSDFLHHYEIEKDIERRRLIAELIAYSLNDAFSLARPSTEMLERAGKVMRTHVDLLEYWACRDAATADDTFALTAWIRTL
ncbi:MAG: hypothetical protein R3F03_07760 [Opitutaceae bacterium]